MPHGSADDGPMLKIHTEQAGPGREDVTTLILAGRLAGPWVQVVRRCWQLADSTPGMRCCLDLRDVSYIDRDGRALLADMSARGAEFLASGCLTEAIVNELRAGSSQTTGTDDGTESAAVRGGQTDNQKCARSAQGRCVMAVTLINVFSVPKDKEQEFVQWWNDVKVKITAEEGFVSGRFHKSLASDSRFNFINMAIWENDAVYWKAYEKTVTPMKATLARLGVEMTPALYQVLFEY